MRDRVYQNGTLEVKSLAEAVKKSDLVRSGKLNEVAETRLSVNEGDYDGTV